MENKIQAIVEAILADSQYGLKGQNSFKNLRLTDLSLHVTIAIERSHTRASRVAVEDAIRERLAKEFERVVMVSSVDPEEGEQRVPDTHDADEKQDEQAHAHSGLPERKRIPGVKHVVLVCSAKGGVGKSTIALNLALSLAKTKRRNISLLDLDIYGPSLPSLIGRDIQPLIVNDKIVPPEVHGISVMSIGFMLEDDKALMWRGPMLAGVINQMIFDVDWQGTDILVIDMPPGTGDTYLSVLQSIHVDGAVIVTTPSELALADVKRGVGVFAPFEVPVIGVVENMASYDWDGRESVLQLLDTLELADDTSRAALERAKRIISTTENIHVFGNRTKSLLDAMKIKLLSSIPLDIALQTDNDNATPYMLKPKKASIEAAFMKLAVAIESYCAGKS